MDEKQKDLEAHSADHEELATSEKADAAPHKDNSQLTEAAMDAELRELETELSQTKVSNLYFTFKDPKLFTYVLVGFASMGGLLSGLDQSLISGANIDLPDDLHLNSGRSSLVDAGMPLGAVGGALILSPANELLGRRLAIILACVFYTIGAALEAGAINFGMMFAGRFILGMGVGLEGGTVPVYVAECSMSPLILLSSQPFPAHPVFQFPGASAATWSRCTS